MTQDDRPTNYTLVGLLAELGQVQVSFQREDDEFLAMAVAVFTFQGRQLLTVERTYCPQRPALSLMLSADRCAAFFRAACRRTGQAGR